jgi:hypothetical protein
MRRRHPPTRLIVACGFTVGFVTQAACRPPVPITGTGTHDRVTVTGCVTSLTRTVGTDGHQTATTHVTRYVLTNIGAGASDSTGVVSTTGAADSHQSISAFWLDASDSQALSYVGSGIEVQGTLEGNRSFSVADSLSRMRPSRLEFLGDSGSLPALPVVKVESVRPVALHCSKTEHP